MKITMQVEIDVLDRATVKSLAAMLVFPMAVENVMFRRTEFNTFELQFGFSMNGNIATSTVVFQSGHPMMVAVLLDSLPYPVFLSGTMFMFAWESAGFGADLNFRGNKPLKLDFPNPAMANA